MAVMGDGYELYHGDCLDVMAGLADHSVDTIIADPPYGTTACRWDSVIPFDPMWAQLKRIIKPNGAIVLFGSEPFSSALIMSNPKWYKYSWHWDKKRGNGHLVAKYRPLQRTESIAVFGVKGGSTVYNPQMVKRDRPRKFSGSPSQTQVMTKQSYRDGYTREDYTHRHPTNLIDCAWSNRDGLHPTQKPVDLMSYLVRTYTNAGEAVLDFTMGSGTTGVAAMQEGRNFIGIELDANYFDIAHNRIEDAAHNMQQLPLLEGTE